MILEDLLALQNLEMGPAPDSAENQTKIASLRKKLPAQIAAHYDRMVARGKKGIGTVRNGVCSECHMRVAVGVMATLMQGNDIQLCGTCGRYLYLPPQAHAPQPPPAAVTPKKRAGGRRKAKPAEPVEA